MKGVKEGEMPNGDLLGIEDTLPGLTAAGVGDGGDAEKEDEEEAEFEIPPVDDIVDEIRFPSW